MMGLPKNLSFGRIVSFRDTRNLAVQPRTISVSAFRAPHIASQNLIFN